MITEDKAIEKLSKMIAPKRLDHTLGVRDTAINLAKKYEVNIEQVKWAALLHDCAKSISNNILLQRAEEFGIVVDDICRKVPALLHAPIGAELARREFSITDEQILDAIRRHTLGSENMTAVDKVVFLADYIEPNRTCQAIDKLRAKVKDKSLDEAVRIACENTIKYLIDQEQVIHPRMVVTRNSLI